MINRRTFLHGTAGTMAGSILIRPGTAVAEFQELPSAQDDRLKMLIITAVDAARTAGANYSDARLTFTQDMKLSGSNSPGYRSENMGFGVRAQCDGYWGFASSTVWSKDEAARLGRVAVDNAKANLLSKPRDIDMAPNPNAQSGDWSMPAKDDPFEMDFFEIVDYVIGLGRYAEYLVHDYRLADIISAGSKVMFWRQQKAFGSSDGQFVTQRFYRTGCAVTMQVKKGEEATGSLSQFNILGAGCGFELLRRPNIRESIKQLYEELSEECLLPYIPVDVGRYNCLIHPGCIAPVITKSIGVATEIDRIMGFEANTTGTSYIINPNEELGSLKVGSPLVNVTATRSLPGRLMHAKWDDEGVEPRDIDLVKGGMLTGLQSSREGTSWMKEYLERTGQPVLSSGSTYAIDAFAPPVVHPSDLILHSDPDRDTTITQLREQMEDGVEIKSGMDLMDFQQSTGMLAGSVAFKIKKGKRVARLLAPAMLFRTSELWGNLQALGGASTVLSVGTAVSKNNPWIATFSSVDTPPALFKEMSLINPAQKA